MRKTALSLVVLVLMITGCPASPPVKTATCFGIPCDFSGKLSKEQEKNVPQALHGAYYIESVQNLNSTELAKEAKQKEKLAEETQNGIRYVALKDYRCVDFGGSSGMMIVVERYRVTDR
jgi:hypothetical protein